jgi:pyruvate/2-oxoglutarate dehydrogenase complex dihydrolipoamide acyltransferase (E2) component
MATEIIVPTLGEIVESVTIVKWLKAEGDPVKEGEPVLEVESQKVTVQVESPASGILGKIFFPKGSEVSVAQVVGIILSTGESLPTQFAEALPSISKQTRKTAQKGIRRPAGKIEQVRAAPVAKKMARQHGIELSQVKPTGPHGTIMKKDVETYLKSYGERAPVEPAPAGARAGSILKASPIARSMAEAHGLDLGAINGTGSGGKILKADILRVLKETSAAAQEKGKRVPERKPEAGPFKEAAESIPIEGVRQFIFNNMHQSLSQSAQVTLHTEASAESLITLREQLGRDTKKPSYNAILVKIAAEALCLHPRINASVQGDTIQVWRQINIGLAIEANESLIVPVIRSPNRRTIAQIDSKIRELIDKARENKLVPDDLADGTFTVSNLGFAGVDFFTPIIRPPESAVLGVGRIVQKPGVNDRRVVPEKRIGLSLTFDHRIIDGAPAARFLETIMDMIEDPLLLIR